MTGPCVLCVGADCMWCRCPCHTITNHTDVDREGAHNPDVTDDQGKHGDDGSGQ